MPTFRCYRLHHYIAQASDRQVTKSRVVTSANYSALMGRGE